MKKNTSTVDRKINTSAAQVPNAFIECMARDWLQGYRVFWGADGQFHMPFEGKLFAVSPRGIYEMVESTVLAMKQRAEMLSADQLMEAVLRVAQADSGFLHTAPAQGTVNKSDSPSS